jgi:acetyltransferase-like isoleucine patch superfamily enzyme
MKFDSIRFVKQKNILLKAYGESLLKLSLAISTFYTFVRYWHHLKTGPHVRFQQGVIFKPYYSFKNNLVLNLKGWNSIGHGSVFQGSGKIVFGERSYCAGNCVFSSNSEITIGKNVMIADQVTIRDTDHKYDDINIPMIDQGITTKEVIINDDVWLGHGSMVLKGVNIGKCSIIAAGSVVINDVPEYAIIGGVPGKVIGWRKNPSENTNENIT